ncbi:MAG: hypothetical protein DHS20C08_18680 [Rhodomicrobium sp.]|nr:MAG: hypothetical protein DHS20C08_18680 [Rhodomicrobium sp.]
MSKRLSISTLGLFMAVFVSLSTIGTSAHAKTCWPYSKITATAGIAVKQSTAKKYGRINWRVKVRAIATLGTAYDNWGIANERSYNCKKKYGTWRCNASARPCRP